VPVDFRCVEPGAHQSRFGLVHRPRDRLKTEETRLAFLVARRFDILGASPVAYEPCVQQFPKSAALE
jgi:hypothetical protein